jgi:lipopolysaccharide transport system permease protein
MSENRTRAPAWRGSLQLGSAIGDLRAGLWRFELWGVLGWHDIRQRYRRSVIGPFWLTISTAVMVGAMGFLYARIFKQEVSSYLPYLAVGLVVWGTISTMVNESCVVFTIAEQIIKQIRLPLTTHVCRLVWRNAIIFAHNAIILAVIMLWYGNVTFPNLVAALLGIVALFLTGIWGGLVIGILCTRFRDVTPLVANVMQIAFFLTPILWHRDVLGDRTWVTAWNPVFHLVEVVRAPLLGQQLPAASYGFVSAMTAGGFLFALAMLTRYRSRVPYWL